MTTDVKVATARFSRLNKHFALRADPKQTIPIFVRILVAYMQHAQGERQLVNRLAVTNKRNETQMCERQHDRHIKACTT